MIPTEVSIMAGIRLAENSEGRGVALMSTATSGWDEVAVGHREAGSKTPCRVAQMMASVRFLTPTLAYSSPSIRNVSRSE